MERGQRIQLHLTLPYKLEPGKHPRVARLLAEGYRVLQLQRLTDRDAIVTLERTA
jgi:hypothetical protein